MVGLHYGGGAFVPSTTAASKEPQREERQRERRAKRHRARKVKAPAPEPRNHRPGQSDAGGGQDQCIERKEPEPGTTRRQQLGIALPNPSRPRSRR